MLGLGCTGKLGRQELFYRNKKERFLAECLFSGCSWSTLDKAFTSAQRKRGTGEGLPRKERISEKDLLKPSGELSKCD